MPMMAYILSPGHFIKIFSRSGDINAIALPRYSFAKPTYRRPAAILRTPANFSAYRHTLFLSVISDDTFIIFSTCLITRRADIE